MSWIGYTYVEAEAWNGYSNMQWWVPVNLFLIVCDSFGYFDDFCTFTRWACHLILWFNRMFGQDEFYCTFSLPHVGSEDSKPDISDYGSFAAVTVYTSLLYSPYYHNSWKTESLIITWYAFPSSNTFLSILVITPARKLFSLIFLCAYGCTVCMCATYILVNNLSRTSDFDLIPEIFITDSVCVKVYLLIFKC